MFIKQMIVGSMSVCCYILACESTGQGMIIDPGGDEDAILAACAKQGITVVAIVNTHGHPDHVCGNAGIKQATGAPIIMHTEDNAFFNKPLARQYFSMLGLAMSPPADRTVMDGDSITAGTVSLTVIHTPGHTPGGICLYSAPHLFSGDTLFVGAVGRSDFPGGDQTALIASIRERLMVLPDDTVVWPGHGYGGDSSTIGAERRENPYINGEI